MSAQMKLPANHTALHEDEMMYITGGASVDTVVKAVVAVGGTAALLVVGGIALRAILNVLGGQRGLSGVVEDSIASGQNFIDGALAAGRNFLNSLMGL